MTLIYEGNLRELFKRNSAYIEIAKRNGFFQDRNSKKDIFTSVDSIVFYWIDELSKDNKEISVYISQVLPSFKRWKNNGVSILGVGSNYDFIRAVENSGIEINSSSIGFILGISRKYHDKDIKLDKDSMDSIISKLVIYHMNNIPIDYRLVEKFESFYSEERRYSN